MTWKDAHVGGGTGQVALRVTDDEKARLEALRQEFRLTSKGQVIRAALDLLEATTAVSDVLIGGDLEATRRGSRRLRRHAGVPRRSDVQAAAADDAIAKRMKVKTSYKHVVNGPGPGADGLPTAPALDRSTEEQ